MVRVLTSVGVLALLAMSGCVNTTPGGEDKQSVTLRFAAQVGDQVVQCGETYEGIGTTSETIEVTDLRMYVSNVRLLTHDGQQVPLELEQDGKWQVEGVALLDFEDGTAACNDTGTDDTNTEIVGSVPAGDYDGVMFDVGVPFELNHDDLAAAPSPLNVSAMFWSWAVGHMFTRFDLQTSTGDFWTLHLGSTGCETDGPQSPPVSACEHPNRPTFVFEEIVPNDDTIVLDLGELFANSDLTQDTPDTAAGCQSFSEDEAECATIFPTLGLDFATGVCMDDCATQRAFRAESGLARGQTAFNTLRTTTGGQIYACTTCHGADGSGLVGPDIRASPADHLYEHSHGTYPHPEGVKFPEVTQHHCHDIAVYLNSLCAQDPDCGPFDPVSHSHDE